MIDAGVEERRDQAECEGHAILVSRLAGLKFGVETAERLSKVMEEIDDLEGIARIGDRIIECETGAELLARVVQQVLDRHPEAEYTMLWEAVRVWVMGGAESCRIGEEALEEAKSPRRPGTTYPGIEKIKERIYREGFLRGRAEGRRATELAMIVSRQARIRFGADTAERLAQLMVEIVDPERITRIGERVIESETAGELLERARDLARAQDD